MRDAAGAPLSHHVRKTAVPFTCASGPVCQTVLKRQDEHRLSPEEDRDRYAYF
jgi:hypothetical protein